MSRKKAAPKRKILADPLFGEVIPAKFVSVIMRGGAKSKAQKILYSALNIVAERKLKRTVDIYVEEEARSLALDLFKRALRNVTPVIEVKSRRVGGATYQVPIDILPDRKAALARRLLIEAAQKRQERGMILKLAGEIMDASDDQPRGGAIKRREEMHRMAKANQSFSHHTVDH